MPGSPSILRKGKAPLDSPAGLFLWLSFTVAGVVLVQVTRKLPLRCKGVLAFTPLGSYVLKLSVPEFARQLAAMVALTGRLPAASAAKVAGATKKKGTVRPTLRRVMHMLWNCIECYPTTSLVCASDNCESKLGGCSMRQKTACTKDYEPSFREEVPN